LPDRQGGNLTRTANMRCEARSLVYVHCFAVA
jgi:hypothetical protein